MHIGVLRIYFLIFDSSSLKGKRKVLNSIRDRLHHRYNVSIAEIGSQDKWNAAELGVVMVGSDHRYVNGAMEKVKDFIATNPQVSVMEHRIDML